MSEFRSAAELETHYAAIAKRPQMTLTFDQNRSLRYYKADQRLKARESLNPIKEGQVQAWVAKANELEAFIRNNERVPRSNNRLPAGAISEHEKTLATWVYSQRKARQAGRLCSYQIDRLDLLAGFSWAPHADQWQKVYADYAAFLSEHGRAPTDRACSAEERALADWASRNRRRLRSGDVSDEQRRALRLLGILGR